MLLTRSKINWATILWISLIFSIAACQLGYWLLYENHAYGVDESTFVLMLHKRISLLVNGLSPDSLFRFYYDGWYYPPVFFLLSIPSFYSFDGDILFSVKLMIVLLYLAYVIIVYRILRRFVNPLGSGVGCLLILSSIFWVLASHHYYIDSLVGFEIALLLLLSIRCIEKHSYGRVLLTGCALAICFLTKFSFLIYAIPIGLTLCFYLFKKNPLLTFFKKILLLGLPSIVFAAPWYYLMLTSGALLKSYQRNQVYIRFPPLSEGLAYLFSHNTNAYFALIFICMSSIIIVLFLIQHITKRTIILIKINKFLRRSHEYDDSKLYIRVLFISFIVFTTAVLYFLGRLWIWRWNFSPLIIILLFCSIFDFFKKGELILTVLTIPIVVSGLIQINSSLLDNQLPVLSRYGLAYNHNYAQNCRVSNTPANQETVYSIINEDALIHNTKNYRASLLFHNISFMHNTAMQAIGLLKDNNAPRWFYLPNALDPRGELEFDFFLETPGKTPDYFYFAIDTGGTKTTDTRNYQNFQSYITRVPDSFWAQATHVADVSGRDGMLVQIYRLEPGSFDRKILADMAKYAALFDPLHATQHRIREIRFGLEYGTRTHEDAENILSLTALNSLDASVKELYPERSADIDFILFRAPGLRAAAVTPFRKDYLPEELAALREIETDNEYFTTKSADSGFCVAIPPRLAGKKISVSIELTAPEGSKILYCQYALNCPPWLNMPISTLSHRLAEGHQKMSFVIPENSASGMLRFSLEGTPGTYRIHGVTLSE